MNVIDYQTIKRIEQTAYYMIQHYGEDEALVESDNRITDLINQIHNLPYYDPITTRKLEDKMWTWIGIANQISELTNQIVTTN